MSPLSKSMHQKSFGDSSTDLRLKRISEKILPQSPYILTVPSTYRVSSDQVNDWRRGSPFGPNEEQLQYVSFLSHTWDDTMLRAVGNWDDGQGGIAKKSSQTSSRSNSGMASPLPGQPRKKISLEAYKSKTVGHIGSKASPAQNGESSIEERVDATAVAPAKEVEPVAKDPLRGQKRPLDAIIEDGLAKPKGRNIVTSPSKKARTSPEPQTREQKLVAKKPTDLRKLPPLLSPTLPADIEDELAKRRTASVTGKSRSTGLKKPPSEPGKRPTKAPQSSHQDPHTAKPAPKDMNASLTKTARPATPKKPISSPIPKPTEALRETAHQKLRISSPEQTTKKPKLNGVTNTKVLVANGLSGKARDETSALAGQRPGHEKAEKKTLLLKLKIPKSARKNWGRIISIQPRPKKPDHSQRNRNSDHEIKAAKEQDWLKAGEKRRRLDEREEAESSNKRQKSLSGSTLIRNPHTPARPTNKSPVLSQHGSAQKSQKSTPKTEVKSTAMRRITSGEGDVKTPYGGTSNGTPTALGITERAGRDSKLSVNAVPNPVATDRNGEIASWRAEQRKYMELGRTLKHAADAILKSPECVDNNVLFDPAAKNRGLAIALETIICYMLAFSIGDEITRINRKAGDVGTWRSILQYLDSVTGAAHTIPHLLGLCLQLGAVCRDTIHAYELEREHDRLERERLGRERPVSADADATSSSFPDQEANTPVGDLLAASRAAQNAQTRPGYANLKADFITELIDNARAWHKGISTLPVDDLQQCYPKTWAKRSKSPGPAKGKERLVAKRYGDGLFYLPLSSASTGIEAVRMGWSFLNEWVSKEGVEWEPRISI